ncbi:MAG TPA: serine/threonine-protein kinase [Gemmatimonadales bacterium]|nr:serine/threonine-protein kinase [Gemmatimonadales bacterium]
MSDPLPHLTGPLAERYRVLQVLGEGGMGVVYEAEQIEPVRRRVALKLLKVGMDSRSFVARFAAERQALAVMDHPNIAKVLDAGSTEEGRPYYVMELVPGLPLTQFCDEQRLGTRGRLELFMDVCHAVQHAHQKGVIHRDLKPTNVLVMVRDDRPIPKVIDFGIAKAIGGSLTERTLVTEHGRPMGTAAYMSPEQWDAAQLDIDTRSDIYSLGVMLYELLVGRLPVDPHALVRAGVGAAALLRDTAPVPPSAWFQSGDQVAITAAKERDTAPQVLVRELRGDLDWITLKAMDHDRRGRYATAHELALDIGRHLRSEPVVAGRPSASYRLGRFARRHRIGVAAAAATMVAVIGFVAMTLVQASRVARERDRAEAAAATATALNRFLTEALLSPDPIEGIGKDATMVEALDSAVARLRAHPVESPAAHAAVNSAIGWAYYRLGLYDQAGPLLLEALAIRRRAPTGDSAELSESLLRVGAWYEIRAQVDSAARLYQEALSLREGGGSSDLSLASVLTRVGSLLRDRDDKVGARRALDEADTIYRRRDDTAGIAAVDNHMGLLLYAEQDLGGAVTRLEASLAARRRLYGRHPLVAEVLSNLGAVLEDQRRLDEAEASYREAMAIGIERLGADNDMVTSVMNNLALLLAGRGKTAEAERLYRQALATDQRKFGPDHPFVGTDALNLASLLCRAGDPVEGLTLARRAREIMRTHQGADSWEAATATLANGGCLTRLRRFSEAEAALHGGLQVLEREFGAGHWRVDSARSRLRTLYEAWGKPERAREYGR